MAEEQIDPVDIMRQCIRGIAIMPTSVQVTLTDHTISVVVASEDVRRIIGVSGKTARALRTILSAVCTTQGERYALDIKG